MVISFLCWQSLGACRRGTARRAETCRRDYAALLPLHPHSKMPTVLVHLRSVVRWESPWETLMTKPLERDAIYLKRHFDAEIIVLCVSWYITYKLSYRDLAAMMAERAVVVSHTTIMRWVIRYAPEFEKRWRRFSRCVGCSWRVDETYIAIRGHWHLLYRAVEKQGPNVGFLLRARPGIAAEAGVFLNGFGVHTHQSP